jgi:hypothetical protein
MIIDFIACLVAMHFDPRLVTGVNAWLKPAKFGLSSAVTCVTLAGIASSLISWPRLRAWSGRVFSWSIAIEIVVIDLQAARGTTSHFNLSTPFNKGAFFVMGISICTLWLSMAAMTIALMRQEIAPTSLKLALRLGLLLSLLGAAGGGFMLRQTPDEEQSHSRLYFGAHTVGAPDGGAGLPVVNWSAQHGDLRVPHFLGLHAMQAIPLVGLWLLRMRKLSERQRIRLVCLASFGYIALFALLTWQALRGQALLEPDRHTLLVALFLLGSVGIGSALILIGPFAAAVSRWANILEVRA